jgi:uncharacterized protein YprB with RNaseH-like and TPR domain
MDLTSRLRSIVRSGPSKPARHELTYEPDDGYRASAPLDLDRMAATLGGVPIATRFGQCLSIDRRYESDRWHGGIRIGDCELASAEPLRLLDPGLVGPERADPPWTPGGSALPRTIFIDLETTGLSGGAGTVAFLVGCGYFDLGAFQVRQFLLTSYASERALLAAVADFFAGADLIVTYNGKTFDVPMMESRWQFHRMEMPLGGVPHFDMLHPARRLWKKRGTPAPSRYSEGDDTGCRLSTLERSLFDVRRVGDVPGMDIPGRFFRFTRTGDAAPLEPVLEHNRIDLVSLAAVTARAAKLVQEGHSACADSTEALALGRVYERANLAARAEACYRSAIGADDVEVRGEALYRLALGCRRSRRFDEAAAWWREIVAMTEPRGVRRRGSLGELRQCAVEALAIHHEHRDRDLMSARELALFALEEGDGSRSDAVRHRLARLDRKIARRNTARLFST